MWVVIATTQLSFIGPHRKYAPIWIVMKYTVLLFVFVQIELSINNIMLCYGWVRVFFQVSEVSALLKPNLWPYIM